MLYYIICCFGYFSKFFFTTPSAHTTLRAPFPNAIYLLSHFPAHYLHELFCKLASFSPFFFRVNKTYVCLGDRGEAHTEHTTYKCSTRCVVLLPATPCVRLSIHPSLSTSSGCFVIGRLDGRFVCRRACCCGFETCAFSYVIYGEF